MRRPTRKPNPKCRGLIARILRDVRGGTAIEYGLIAALVVIAMIASFRGVADATTGLWNNINSKITSAK